MSFSVFEKGRITLKAKKINISLGKLIACYTDKNRKFIKMYFPFSDEFDSGKHLSIERETLTLSFF